jgi:hypothetical protein
MKVRLERLAIARSGDKGDAANIGVIAMSPGAFPVLREQLTAERVRERFSGICRGRVDRYELPNLYALNFLLHEALGGGGTVSLMLDAQGKTFAAFLLQMEIEVPAEIVAECDRVRSGEAAGRPA